MRLRSSGLLYRINMRSRFHKPHILRRHPCIVLVASHLEKHRHGEPNIERQRAIDLINLLIREIDVQGLNVALQVLNLADADDGIDIG